ncbi:unnamed protein product [Didymodactylos carnosus]|uniref:Uncharacterized protein n=1 Tax=Didymodactylos carnosus TaxID=1234261 RepID=A0A816BU08_9BILA|nr:unnamed protein product [Didymodactylos carnosus]CAF4495370.1 unnamed protein product [Didymodactylos carnosus]
MILILYSYLKNVKIESGTKFTVYNNTYTLTKKGVNFFRKLPQAGLSLINLVNFMNSSEGKDKMTVISIKNFQLCLGSILADVQSINQNYDGIAATFTQFDKDQSYIKLLDKARGCTAKCPCCLRACDADHSLVKLSPGLLPDFLQKLRINNR